MNPGTRNSELHKQIADLLGMDYRETSNHNFTSEQVRQIAEDLGIMTDALSKGRVMEAIGEEAGFDFEQGYSTTPRAFQTGELKKILGELE